MSVYCHYGFHCRKLPISLRLVALFAAARAHHLQADADAEDGFAALDPLALQGVAHTRHAIEAGAPVGESADARQHDAVGARALARVRGDEHAIVHAALARSTLEGFGGGPEIARAVIDDCHRHWGDV